MRWLILGCALSIALFSVVQADSTKLATAHRFATAFERGDYQAMHDELGGLLALLFRPSVLKNSFGQLRDVLDQPRLDSLARRSANSFGACAR